MTTKPRRHKDLEDFIDKTSDINGCWIWKGSTNQKGYGLFHIKHSTVMAHRAVYEKYKGSIPDDLQLDHIKEKCKRKDCVNPDHTEPVTNLENRRRRITGIYKTIVARNRAEKLRVKI